MSLILLHLLKGQLTLLYRKNNLLAHRLMPIIVEEPPWYGRMPLIAALFKFGLTQDNYLPVKVEFNIDFQGDTGGPGAASTVFSTPTINPINSNFQGELDFSNYNQSVSIQLPQGALNAQIIGN